MKTRSNITVQRNIAFIAIGSTLLLLIPLSAMQFTEEVAWTALDFVVAGGLLLGTGLMYVLLSRKVRGTKIKLIIGASLLFVLLAIWAEFAVGILG